MSYTFLPRSMTAMPCSILTTGSPMIGPELHDRRNWVSSLPPDPMTDHSEAANKSWGGDRSGKQQTSRHADLALPLQDYSPTITQIMKRPMVPLWGTGSSLPGPQKWATIIHCSLIIYCYKPPSKRKKQFLVCYIAFKATICCMWYGKMHESMKVWNFPYLPLFFKVRQSYQQR